MGRTHAGERIGDVGGLSRQHILSVRACRRAPERAYTQNRTSTHAHQDARCPSSYHVPYRLRSADQGWPDHCGERSGWRVGGDEIGAGLGAYEADHGQRGARGPRLTSGLLRLLFDRRADVCRRCPVGASDSRAVQLVVGTVPTFL